MGAHWYFSIPAALLFLAMVIYLRGLGLTFLRAQLTFSEQQFRGVHSRWSPEARRRYRKHFLVDYAFIALYAAAGWAYGDSHNHPSAGATVTQVATWSLPAAAIADVVENVLHQLFLSSAPGAQPSWRYLLAGIATVCKFCFWLSFAVAATFV